MHIKSKYYRNKNPSCKRRTHRKFCALQLLQISHSPTHNSSLDTQELHPRCHDTACDSTILLLWLFYHNNGSRVGRVCILKVACIVYPVLTRRETMFIGILSCSSRWTIALIEELECSCWSGDLLRRLISAGYRGEGGCRSISKECCFRRLFLL